MSDTPALSRRLLFGVAAGAALASAVAVFAVDRLIPGASADQARIGAAVHDYVLDHPEIVPEAMQRLQEREAAKAVAANRGAIVTPVGSAWEGNPNGDVTLAEYLDYNCGYCRASLPVVAQLLKDDPKLRIVYHDLPVLSPESVTAARLSVAAALQGKFKPLHDALYAGGRLTDASMAAAATKAGLDPAKLSAQGQSPVVEQVIGQNIGLAHELGMSGTPTWVIGNRVVSGAQPLERLKQLIAEARAAR